MKNFRFFFLKVSLKRVYLLVVSSLFLIMSPVEPGMCQPLLFPYYQGFLNIPRPNPFFTSSNPPLSIHSTEIEIWKEFPYGVIDDENLYIYLRTTNPISVLITLINTSGKIYYLEALSDDMEYDFLRQGDKIVLPLGGDKLNGKWHKWELYSIDEYMKGVSDTPYSIIRINIKGDSFCLGGIATFSEDVNGDRETSYLASFTEERERLIDYAWNSLIPLTCEYSPYNPDNQEWKEMEEGYICIDSQEQSSPITTPKVPFNTMMPVQWGPSPLFPVTILTQSPLTNGYPLFYPSVYDLYQRASFLYSSPINLGLALNIQQSLPFYIQSQFGTPYSLKNNLFQSQGLLAQYPSDVDYRNDPAYVYLGTGL